VIEAASTRRVQRWDRIAASMLDVSNGKQDCMVLPNWRWCNFGMIGRRGKTPAKHRSILPLADLKLRRRQAMLVLKGFDADSDLLDSNSLMLKPYKGKPCQLLLGKQDRRLRESRLLEPGDIFCIGHSHIRVAILTVPAPTATEAARLEVMQDKGKRYRRKASKERKRQKKQQGDDSSSEDDSTSSSSSDAAHEYCDVPRLTLEIVGGPLRGKVFSYGREGAVIGRAASCTLPLRNDTTVSPVHARVTCLGSRWHLTDCGSRHGSFLLVPDLGTFLRAGDLVRLGNTEITWLVRAHLGHAPSAAEAEITGAPDATLPNGG